MHCTQQRTSLMPRTRFCNFGRTSVLLNIRTAAQGLCAKRQVQAVGQGFQTLFKIRNFI